MSDALRSLGSFEPLDLELARALSRLAGGESAAVELAIALTSRNVRRGHSCFPLGTSAREIQLGLDGPLPDLPSAESWASEIADSRLTRGGPMVLDDAGRLYLRRYWELEQDIAAQLANRIGLPSGVASSMSDAKAVDAQMGMEKALSSLACGLAGANMVYESSGMMASLLGASFEAFLLDNEMLSHVYRMLRGVEVSDATLAFETMKNVITGEGHFIGETQTMQAMERDYFYPRLGDRLEPTAWAEAGASDAWQRANVEVREILDRHRPAYIEAEADKTIRQRFNILLP